MERKIAGYGWNRDLPDGRDFMYGAPPEVVRKLPESVDLRPGCPPVRGATSSHAPRTYEQDQDKQRERHQRRP